MTYVAFPVEIVTCTSSKRAFYSVIEGSYRAVKQLILTPEMPGTD
jgi:hypothetical protein